MLKLKPIVVGVALAFAFSTSITFAGGAASGGASEVTQVMNNGELIAATSKQAQLVAGQIRDYTSQVNQYVTMVQNLKNLPVAVVAATLKPYKETLRDLGELYRAVDDVYVAGGQAYSTYERRKAEMANMNMSYDQYLNMETLLAASKGGQYKVQYEKDIAALKKLQDKATTLAGMDSQINAVSGNVEGLQLLAQQNQIMAGELMELNSQLLKKSAQEAADKELQMKVLEKERADREEEAKRVAAINKKTNEKILGGKFEAVEKRKEILKEW